MTGLRARGGIELTRMAWVKRRLTEIEIKATDRGWDELVRHYPAGFFFWGGVLTLRLIVGYHVLPVVGCAALPSVSSGILWQALPRLC